MMLTVQFKITMVLMVNQKIMLLNQKSKFCP